MKPLLSCLRPSLLVTACLAIAPLQAGQATAAASNQQKELEQAQADLKRAAERVAELSGKNNLRVVELRRLAESRVMLGVLLAPDPGQGVRVAGVTPNGGAAKAGLRAGDRILQIDGQPVVGSTGEIRLGNAQAALTRLKADVPVTLVYLRDGKSQTTRVTPQAGSPVIAFRQTLSDGKGTDWEQVFGPEGELVTENLRGSEWEFAVAPAIRSELLQLRTERDCGGHPCPMPQLSEAFRWSGFNLAALDKQLGRYFGTDHGVLVLSAGDELSGLQPGDVIQKVDGKPVATPREAMATLRGKPADSTVRVDYLRDRRSGTAQIKIPELMPLRIPVPPAPPAAPAPPAPPAPVDAPAPPPPPSPPEAVRSGARSSTPQAVHAIRISAMQVPVERAHLPLL